MDLIDNSKINLKDAFLRFEKEAETLDLKINEDKTKYMYLSRDVLNRDKIGKIISIEDYNFERARQFKYLGTNISQWNRTQKNQDTHIQHNHKTYSNIWLRDLDTNRCKQRTTQDIRKTSVKNMWSN